MVVLDDKSDLEWIRLVEDTRLEENTRLASLSPDPMQSTKWDVTCRSIDPPDLPTSPVDLMNYTFPAAPHQLPRAHTVSCQRP